MYSCDELFMRSLECYFGVYFPRCCATREINTKITLSWAHKQFATQYIHYSIFNRVSADGQISWLLLDIIKHFAIQFGTYHYIYGRVSELRWLNSCLILCLWCHLNKYDMPFHLSKRIMCVTNRTLTDVMIKGICNKIRYMFYLWHQLSTVH